MASADVPRQPAYRGIRTGGRSERVRAAIIGAAVTEMVSVGFAELSLARVAAGAEVALTTIHRRWSSKSALAADVILDALCGPFSVPAGASLAADVEALTRAVREAFGRPDVSALMKAAMLLQPAEFDAIRRRVEEVGTEIGAPLVARAVERGELSPATDPLEVVELMLAGLWMRAFVSGGRLDDRDLEAFAADALAALRREGRAVAA